MPISVPIPAPIICKLQELNDLVEAHQDYIPLTVASKFLGVNAEGLRTSIEHGHCPFGICWQKTIRDKRGIHQGTRAFKIPTVTFYLWYTQGAGLG